MPAIGSFRVGTSSAHHASSFCALSLSISLFHSHVLPPSPAQVAYNLKNHLFWLVLFPYFSPTGTANLFMVADFMFIFPVALIYAAAYLGNGKAMV